MIVYVLIILILVFSKSQIRLRGINKEYISKEATYSIKGIFILLIFASHFSSYIPAYTQNIDILYWNIRIYLGQCVVAMFLFYSGYGVMKSAATKGKNYIDVFPEKRIIKTLLIYDFSQVFFFVVQSIFGRKYTLLYYLQSLLAWTSFGNDNWYIFVILILYLMTWLVLLKVKKPLWQTLLICLGSIIFIQVLMHAEKGKYWYNSLLCFTAGTVWHLMEEKAENFLSRDRNYMLTIFLVITAFVCLHRTWDESIVTYEITVILFAFIIVLLSMKISIHNVFLKYCGKHLQGLFLLHRIPMILFGQIAVIKQEKYLYFLLCIASAFALEFLFDKMISYMWRENVSKNKEPPVSL